jgi:hypothetical protein
VLFLRRVALREVPTSYGEPSESTRGHTLIRTRTSIQAENITQALIMARVSTLNVPEYANISNKDYLFISSRISKVACMTRPLVSALRLRRKFWIFDSDQLSIFMIDTDRETFRVRGKKQAKFSNWRREVCTTCTILLSRTG